MNSGWMRSHDRYESWWAGEMIDRPVIQVTAPRNLEAFEPPPTDAQQLHQWFTDPDRVVTRIVREVAATYYAGDAFPLAFPVSGNLAAIQAAYLGCPYRVEPISNSGWAEPIITSWDSLPEINVDPDNRWWRQSQILLHQGARRSFGSYAVGIPDLQGGGEILALLRGTERLAMDLVDHPDYIVPAIERINRAWLDYYQQCFEIIHAYQDGWVDWLGVWSDRPAVTVECDFNAMISPEMFVRYFLPGVEQQCSWIGRTIFHLDGPGALPHLDALLALSSLAGIQWVPGAGAAEMTAWIPLLQRIQSAGKRLVLTCEPWEVDALVSELQPAGLLLQTTCSKPSEAEDVVSRIDAKFGVRPLACWWIVDR
jgi:5-methyltetrahydrofolate--homocysteine methyltransferase